MKELRFFTQPPVPVEMHKVRIVQQLNFPDLDRRIEANRQAGNNAHLLRCEDVFLDMLTDSGVNAMSDEQLAAMMKADDAYAGSASYYRLEQKAQEMFGMPYFLPAHQGRACEHLLCKLFLKSGQLAVMNYHFTTTRAHVETAGGEVVELLYEQGMQPQSDVPFKGDMDVQALEQLIQQHGAEKIAFVRIEAGTNLIGGQPVSLGNMQAVQKVCKQHGILLILDASLLADNIFFNQQREEACRLVPARQLIKQISDCFDIIYFSARKLTCARGGGMCFRNEQHFKAVRDLIPLYEGFATYGGMSVREIEAMAVGLEETACEDFISQGPIFIQQMAEMLLKAGVPIVTPPGGLGLHLDATGFVPHIPPAQYPAAALHCALYLVSGIRGTERGSLSEERDENGQEVPARMELLRLALPRRVFTLSQITYAVDRIIWLYRHRSLIGGLRFEEEPKTLRFFFGRLAPVDDWQDRLVAAFRQEVDNLA